MIGEEIRNTAHPESIETLLELQRQEHVREHNRSSKRVGIHCRVEILPGNSRERHLAPIQGACSDLSTGGGCRLISDAPPAVGDIYWIRFEKNVDIPSVFARCIRCRLLREDAFESGFQFFSEMTLPLEENEQTETDVIDVI